MTDISQPTWPDILDRLLDKRLRGVHTSAPGKIVSYDATTQTASVQLVIKAETAKDTFEETPPLTDVPVLHLRGSSFFVHIPLEKGDPVYVHFSEQDPAQYFDTKVVTEPPLKRRHGLYAWAIPAGLTKLDPLPPTVASSSKMVLGDVTGTVIAIDSTGVEIGALTGAAFLAKSAELLAWAANVNASLNALGAPVAALPATVATTKTKGF